MAKVVHIITGLNQGGAETVLTRLLEYSKFSDDFYVISLTGKGYYSEKIKYPTYHLNFSGPISFFYSLFQLVRILRRLNPDIIQTWLYHADLIGGVTGKIFTKATIFWNLRNGNLDPKYISRGTWLVAKICAFFSGIIPDTIISCSRKAADTHQEFGYNGSKFVIIPNGHNFPIPNKTSSSKNIFLDKYNLPKDAILLGNISRWNPLKDHKTLLESFALVLEKNQNIYLLLIGKDLDEANNELRDLIERLKLRKQVILMGQLNDISNVLNVLDLFILSSVGEAFPNVLIEAMSYDIPCISTNVGDAAYILGDKSSIVQPQAPEEMATAINIKLDFVRSGAKNNIYYVERIKKLFSIENMCLQYHLAWVGSLK